MRVVFIDIETIALLATLFKFQKDVLSVVPLLADTGGVDGNALMISSSLPPTPPNTNSQFRVEISPSTTNNSC